MGFQLFDDREAKQRICIDPNDLNSALKGSNYPLQTIEEILPNLSRAKVFSVLDARNGFWYVEMDKGSSMLTTFDTPLEFPRSTNVDKTRQ